MSVARRRIDDGHTHAMAGAMFGGKPTGQPSHCIHCGCTEDQASIANPLLYPIKPRLLNVGGGSRWLLPMFDGWEQDLLDVDESCGADIVCDARTLKDRPVTTQYDAVYNSHFLEHVHQHEVPLVLEGFYKHLKPGGFVYTMVPDLRQLFSEIQTKDLDDVWYMAGENPVTYADVLFGWNAALRSGKPYMAHKYGFTPPTLDKALKQFFPVVLIARDGYNLHCLAIKVVL